MARFVDFKLWAGVWGRVCLGEGVRGLAIVVIGAAGALRVGVDEMWCRETCAFTAVARMGGCLHQRRCGCAQ